MKRLTLLPILGCLLTALLFLPLPATAKGGYKSASAGSCHVVVLKEDGTLWGWGANWAGQLGDGPTTSRTSPVKILDGVKQVSAGGNSTMAILNDGTLWGWGGNLSGQLGDGTKTNCERPVKILDGVKQISAGPFNTMAILNDGSLWGWGVNYTGQLGDGTTTSRTRPVKILDGVKLVSGGAGNNISHTMAILNDGSLWGWGDNEFGQLGDGTKTERHRPVKIAENVKDVACGISYTIYITENGELMECGKLIW